jgi:hypothetical protein
VALPQHHVESLPVGHLAERRPTHWPWTARR